jgi:hypothetical protein
MCLLMCALCEGACDFGLVVLMASEWQEEVDKVIVVARVNNNIKHLIWSHGICVS